MTVLNAASIIHQKLVNKKIFCTKTLDNVIGPTSTGRLARFYLNSFIKYELPFITDILLLIGAMQNLHPI